MCSPSATLTVWASAWLAGSSAPDDVLDALRGWAPRHAVAAGDPITSGRTGLPWPAAPLPRDTGTMTLLQIIRTRLAAPHAHLRLVLPVPGDVRGLPAGSEFAAAALEAEQGVLVGVPGSDGLGLVPQWLDQNTLQWTVFHIDLPAATEPDLPLGEAEHCMREAVRDAADALTQLQTTGLGAAGDPRELVEAELASYTRHHYPNSVPLRARRILDTADHVAAILAVAQREPASAPASATAMAEHEILLRPLWNAIRAARLAAVHASA